MGMCSPSGGISTINSPSQGRTGAPNSRRDIVDGLGRTRQSRWFGPDGRAIWDRDYAHSGNMDFPHDHDWNDGLRGKEHLPVNPEFC